MTRRLIAPVLIVVILILAACASTPIGKAVQVATVQKALVEAAAVEIIKLHLTGGLSDADYQRAKSGYEQWARGQRAMAESLAAWKVVASVENGERLQTALAQMATLTDAYLDFAAQFIDIAGLKDRLK